MNAAKSMFSSSPPFSSSTVMMLHEQAVPAVSSWPSGIAAQHFPTSVLLQEQRDEYRPLLHINKEDKTPQATSSMRPMDVALVQEKDNTRNANELVHNFMQQLHLRCHLQNLLSSSLTREIAASSTLQSITDDSERSPDGLQWNAVSLAKQALSASKQAAAVAEESKLIEADDDDNDDSLPFSLASTCFPDSSVRRNKIVRSTRLKERRSKQRKVSKSSVLDDESYLTRKSDVQGRLRVEKKLKEGLDQNQNDPLRMFLWGPETKKLLTLEEESRLISQIQNLFRLEEVKIRLQSQFGREPTMAEWADGVGLSCYALQTQLRCGKRSKEKLIHANLRMVVHVAKNYLGRGLSFQDLLQEGSMGLMKSVEKFKPQAGCRFASYAYWWIRQTIRRALFLHSRTIRLPENVYTLLGKLIEAKKFYNREGNVHPTKEELARKIGVTVDKLEILLSAARIPLSMQQTVWTDQDTTYQEITADTSIETPDVYVAKQLMRSHTRNLLHTLNPRERRIIRLRFGIEDGYEKSLSEIGTVFGLSKERVRQLESRALDKLKQCLASHGLDAYANLLV